MGTLFSVMPAIAAPAIVEFSAQIAYEGSCDISVPISIAFNNDDPILPSQIEAADSVAKQTFNLTLANCKGIGVTPKIAVIGTSSTDYGKALFIDSSDSTSVGYGILLQTNGNATFKENQNLAENKMISVSSSWDTSTNLKTIEGTLPMTATVTCGDCNASGRIGGELKASVTFDFQYD
nr:fimbrial protein [Providencia sneebia]